MAENPAEGQHVPPRIQEADLEVSGANGSLPTPGPPADAIHDLAEV